eukprot:TCONS_00071962-protein
MMGDNSHTNRGRPKDTPKKNKGFKGTPSKVVKVDQNFEKVLTSIKKGGSSPLRLKNLGQNVCFFNSVLQVLYSNDNFHEFISQLETNCPGKVAMKQLFTLMETSVTPIETYQYVHLMPLLNYNHALKEQYDAHECLYYILSMLYSLDPNVSEPSNVFQISCLQSVLCQTCYNPSEKTVYDSYCRIEFPDRFRENSIENEISKLVNDPHGELLQEAYPCPICPVRTNATKSTILFNVADTLIIQLIIFGFDRTTNSSKKLAPNLTIETKVENVLLGTLHLQGIVYHHGNSPNSGHYTAVVKHGETWYSADDEHVAPFQTNSFRCSVNEKTVPYILIYKKDVTKQTVSTSPACNQSDDNSCSFSRGNTPILTMHDTEENYVEIGKATPSLTAHKSIIDFEISKTSRKEKCDESQINIAQPDLDSIFETEEFLPTLTPEKLLKRSLLQELDRQNNKMNDAETISLKPTPIKRKRKLTAGSKREQMKKIRCNLNEDQLNSTRKSAQKGMNILRDNQTAFEKEKNRKSNQKGMKKLRGKQTEFDKKESQESAQKGMKKLRDR